MYPGVVTSSPIPPALLAHLRQQAAALDLPAQAEASWRQCFRNVEGRTIGGWREADLWGRLRSVQLQTTHQVTFEVSLDLFAHTDPEGSQRIFQYHLVVCPDGEAWDDWLF